jgi:hypothetical protein
MIGLGLARRHGCRGAEQNLAAIFTVADFSAISFISARLEIVVVTVTG